MDGSRHGGLQVKMPSLHTRVHADGHEQSVVCVLVQSIDCVCAYCKRLPPTPSNAILIRPRNIRECMMAAMPHTDHHTSEWASTADQQIRELNEENVRGSLRTKTKCLHNLLPSRDVGLDGLLHRRLLVDKLNRQCFIGTCDALCFELFHLL